MVVLRCGADSHRTTCFDVNPVRPVEGRPLFRVIEASLVRSINAVHPSCCTPSGDEIGVRLVLDHPHLTDREECWFARAVGELALRVGCLTPGAIPSQAATTAI